MQEQAVGSARGGEGLRFVAARLRAVNRFAVLLQPRAHAFQSFEGGGRQFAIGLRTDVEQQVRALTGRTHKEAYELFYRLVVLVFHLIAPHAVHRLARFERQFSHFLPRQSGSVLARHVALKDLKVLAGKRRLVVVVAHEARRLQAMNERILMVQLPVKRHAVLIVVPPAVKPNGINLAVVRKQFGELRVHKVVIALPIGLAFPTRAAARATARIVLPRPIDVGIIKVQPHALVVTFVGEVAQNVAAIRRVHNVVGALRRVPHRKAVVVPRREADILSPRLLERGNPLPGIEAVGIESVGRFGVFLRVDVFIGHKPFALRKRAVNAPVQEDAQPFFGKGLACRQVFGRGLIDRRLCCEPRGGEFIINGVPVEICKNVSGRMISFSNLGIDYRKGLIQYKESKPVRIGSSDPVLPKNFNIGLHFDVSDKKIGYNMNSYRSEIINVKVILSVDADTLKVRFSISITEKRIFADGREVIVSL